MYPGGKNGAGVYQQIINQMPPHRVYIEPFLGSGAVMRYKRPALSNIGIDSDAAAIEAAHKWAADVPGLDAQFSTGNALRYLSDLEDDSVWWEGEELIYCDPPYLFSARRDGERARYACEFGTEAEHAELLCILRSLPCYVILSGYESALYTAMLPGWRTHTFQTVTRGGKPATEWLWMNYPEPKELHDYRYLGNGYRERERIRRKQKRWQERLRTMPALERYALLAAVQEFSPGSLAQNGEAVP